MNYPTIRLYLKEETKHLLWSTLNVGCTVSLSAVDSTPITAIVLWQETVTPCRGYNIVRRIPLMR
jgi:hypothetical protein